MTGSKDSVVNTWVEQLEYALAQNSECDGKICDRSGCVSITDGPYGHPAALALIANTTFSQFIFFIGIFCCTLAPVSTSAQNILAGRASVIDTDTLEIHGQRIRLHGIDAPEASQNCYKPDGTAWRCGQAFSNALSDYINGRPLHCNIKGRDRYKRAIGECYLNQTNLNALIVQSGWALAYRRYSNDFITHEDYAKANRLGLWSGTFVAPWDWRKGVRVD